MSADRPCAALDIGSNTIRLLLARPAGDGLEQVLDQSEFVRLGLGVDASGGLRDDRQQAAIEAIGRLASCAQTHHAAPLLAIATSAVRDAANGQAFVGRVAEQTGVAVQIISGEREAHLTYLGATLGIDTGGGALVCDLGGGSAEVIAARGGRMLWGQSLKIGSGRLTDRHVRHDPPTPREQRDVEDDVVRSLQALPDFDAEVAIFTGGTATHVAWLVEASGEMVTLEASALRRVREMVSAEPAAEIVRRFGIKPERAQVLPAGVCALQAIADFYDAERITITRRGIREGTIVDYLQRQGRWPGAT